MCTFAMSPRGRLVDKFHGKARALGSGFFRAVGRSFQVLSFEDAAKLILAIVFSLLFARKMA
jgi:hypothetical protein